MTDTDALEALGHNPEPDHIDVPLAHKNINTVLRIDSDKQTITIQTQGSPTEWISSDTNIGTEDCGTYTDELMEGKL